MNSGIIASRYAKALLKYVQETGNGDKVYSQAGVLVMRMEEVRQLREYVEAYREVEPERKFSLLEAALGESMADELRRFLTLVIARRRTEYFLRMLHSFILQYRISLNIRVGSLITALPAEGLKEKLEEFTGSITGASVHLEMNVNPDIIGGFVFTLDDVRMDASVRTQIKRIRNRLVEKNNRIV